ncbi:MAG: CehA/McbA family metallohydrolase, partial [Opitutaceae bacterium]
MLLRAAEPPSTLSPSARRAFGGIQPRVSPDGKWIAVSYQGAICRLPSEGGTLIRLTRGEGWDIDPAWSADGKRIVYINSTDFARGRLRVIDAIDGSPVARSLPGDCRGPLWVSPDGRRVLGKFNVAGGEMRAAWCDLDTGAVEPVAGLPDTHSMRGGRFALALSPDGKRILFAEHRDRKGEQFGNQGQEATLWRLPAHGGTPDRIVEWPARIHNITWAADGQGAFIATNLGTSHNDIWHVPFREPSRGQRKLTFGHADEDWPSVSADGRVLIYTENHEGATALVSHDLTNTDRRTLAIAGVDFREPTATLRIRVVDQADLKPIVARISLRKEHGKFHAPAGSMYRITSGMGEGNFYCRDEATLTLPAGRSQLAAYRGPEFRIARVTLDLVAGQQKEITLAMERWVHAAAEGWYSGENHIHANYGYGAWYHSPRTVLDQCEGEDLNVANLVVANSDGDGVFDREFFRGHADPLSTPRTILWWNEEFRSTFWGHLTLFHLHRLVEPIFTGFKGTTNPWDVPDNADIAQRTRAQGGIASYTHPTRNPVDAYDATYNAKGLPVDVALGWIDTLDVMGFVYDSSIPLWYRLLNCGFHLPAAAGTDVFLNRVRGPPPGFGRAYVRLPDGLTYEKWVAGLCAGRSFISDGPMLDFSANDKSAGETLKLPGPGKVRVKGRARSLNPLIGFEVVQDGKVVA